MTDITPTGPSKPTAYGFKGRTGRVFTDTTITHLRQQASIASRNGARYVSGTINSAPRPDSLINSLNNKKTSLETDIATDKLNISRAEKAMSSLTGENLEQNKRNLAIYKDNLAKHSSELAIVVAQLQPRDFSHVNTAGKLKPLPKIKDKKIIPPPPTDTTLRYNVGAVREAYFTSRPEFLLEAKNSTKLHSSVTNNTPDLALGSAAELWSNGQSSKGMFTTWVDLATQTPTDAAYSNVTGTNKSIPPHAFRFQYNPGSISMAYAGTPLTDPNYEASGQDPFNLVGTGVTQSTIQFQLLINRMYDMKYYWREDEVIDGRTIDGPEGQRIVIAGNGATAGTLKPEAVNINGTTQSVYGYEDVDTNTQKAIYNMGTMYDLEFLFRTIMGYTMGSALRDYSFLSNGGTADMGFLGAMPVELHLGKTMRYLVFVTGINVEHVIFDNRMVPLFSNVSITCSRLPDYQGLNVDQQTGTDPVPDSPATSWGNSSNIIQTILGKS